MNSFLRIIAEDLLTKYGTDLSRTVIVFPNKRASLFLNEELVKAASTTLWSPRYITISELFRKQSALIVADHIKLICELYRVYSSISGTSETLDEFYTWGELLLSDFDDVDKNMADARLVFENTSELHEYDSVSYLQPEQIKALQRFFSNFSDNHESKIKKNFEMLWNKLGIIYSTYKEQLRNQGIAYEGMLYRDVVENGELVNLKADRYIFVGFNLVQKVEQNMFNMLKKQNEVHFYWDYDEYYLDSNEAGQNIRDYLLRFPNEIKSRDVFRNFTNDKDITFINAATEDIQARYITDWLTPERIKAGKRTAIVLCNEALLPTVVNCLPPTVENVNITTGYPLANTPVATFVQQFFNLYRIGGSSEKDRLRLHQVNNMLRHPYMQFISESYKTLMQELNESHRFFPSIEELCVDENMTLVFSPISAPTASEANILIAERLMQLIKIVSMKRFGKKVDDSEAYNLTETNDIVEDPLMQETLFRAYTLLSRIKTLAAEDGLEVDTITFQHLITQAIRSASVPFHGEPIIGIQIMGVLETRNLDFDHILLLSCNEGNMPKGVNDASFIPHVIRKAYGLTTVENKVGIYAYYFHRLLQRASDIQIAYNSSTEDGQMGEKSRFMSQLLAESNIPIKLCTFNAPLQNSVREHKPIEKDAIIMDKLNSKSKISPSAINTYLRCPLQFFYKEICGIRDENENEDDTELDNRVFGLIFHNTMETLYRPFQKQVMTSSILESLLKDKRKIEYALERAIKIELFKFDKETADNRKLPRLDGSQMIQRNVLRRLIHNQIQFDMRTAPVAIRGLEKHVYRDFSFILNNEQRSINLHGYIDRLDIVTGPDGKPIMRVVDYKTGNAKQPALGSCEDIFNPAKIDNHSDYYLQTLLYCIIEKRNRIDYIKANGEGSAEYYRISPNLIYPSHARNENYTPTLTLGLRNSRTTILDISDYEEEFEQGLEGLLQEIFSPSVPFEPTPHINRCDKCFYASICGTTKKAENGKR